MCDRFVPISCTLRLQFYINPTTKFEVRGMPEKIPSMSADTKACYSNCDCFEGHGFSAIVYNVRKINVKSLIGIYINTTFWAHFWDRRRRKCAMRFIVRPKRISWNVNRQGHIRYFKFIIYSNLYGRFRMNRVKTVKYWTQFTREMTIITYIFHIYVYL